MTDQKVPIGKVLIANGIITKDQLENALAIQSNNTDKRIGDILLEMQLVTEKQLMMALESKLRTKYIELDDYQINKGAVDLLAKEFAEQFNLIPIDIEDDNLIVATSDPMDYFTIEEIEQKTGYRVRTVLAANSKIKEAIGVYYELDTGLIANSLNSQYNSDEFFSVDDIDNLEVENAPIVRFVNSLFRVALKANSTDIHIEPMKDKTRIRMRIDGMLTTQMELKSAIHSTLITRIKIISGMNIAEKRLPQDGRYETNIDGRLLDMRISSIPSIYGEKIVVRLLSGVGKLLDVNKLGLGENNTALFESIIKSPNGIVLVCGPTGSGKSTTLYSILGKISDSKNNTITVEDPVEYRVDGITQIQVNTKSGLTFASGLRSILRQDPDIIMVGEIRDVETAEIAVRSAITGHLVLSTIHTNDAASTVSRLVDMGIEPYLVASALRGIISQRLVKKLCNVCKEEYLTTDEEREYLMVDRPIKIYKPKGCPECAFTGYRGRMAIFEILPVNQTVRDFIIRRASIDEIRKYNEQENKSTLKGSSYELVLSGAISFEEMTRVTYSI